MYIFDTSIDFTVEVDGWYLRAELSDAVLVAHVVGAVILRRAVVPLRVLPGIFLPVNAILLEHTTRL